MIKRFLSLLWILHLFQDVLSQYVLCPYEKGLYYATSPECLVYYRCENRMLWSGVCFPWQRFDMQSLRCRYLENVDCNPEYGGIWRRLYQEIDQINHEVQETNEVLSEAIKGATTDDFEMLGNEGKEEINVDEPEETIDKESEYGAGQEMSEEDTVINSKAGEEGLKNDVLQGQVVKADDAPINKQSGLNNSEEKKIERDEEQTIQEITPIENKNKNDQNKANIGNEDAKIEQEEITNAHSGLESQNLNTIKDQQDDSKNKRDVNAVMGGKFLRLSKNMPIAKESIIPDLMGPIITSVFTEESTTKSEGVTNNYDEETTSQSTTDAEMEQFFIESTTSVTGIKDEDSSGRFWYWCGSGRFVMTQTPEDPNTICLQLEDPQFIDEEGAGTGTQDWGGHTFLGSGTSVSKRHT